MFSAALVLVMMMKRRSGARVSVPRSPNTPLPQKLSAPGPQALFGALRRAPSAAGCLGVVGEVTVSVTVYFDNHDNLYVYSPRSGEAN